MESAKREESTVGEFVWHGTEAVLTEPAPDLHGPTHLSRRLQERVLSDPDDAGAWRELRRSYDDMAPEWREWTEQQGGYDLPVRLGLKHARPAPWAVEICCGTGEATGAVTEHAPRVVALDLNASMVRGHPQLPGAEWILASVTALPFSDGTVPLLVSLNGVLHPEELIRVVRPGGQVLWCTSFGPGTPLYVEPERVHRLLGESWTAEGGRAGHGEWALFTAPEN